jgi:hypothetical protein
MRGAIHALPQYVLMAWCLVKHRDNFTFTPYNTLQLVFIPLSLIRHTNYTVDTSIQYLCSGLRILCIVCLTGLKDKCLHITLYSLRNVMGTANSKGEFLPVLN